MKRHQTIMRFDRRRQRDDESIDRFMDNLKSLGRRSDPEESFHRGILTLLQNSLSKDIAPDPEEMGQKSRKYMLRKSKKYSFSGNRSAQEGSQQQRSTWYKPRDDSDKCTNADHVQVVGQQIIT